MGISPEIRLEVDVLLNEFRVSTEHLTRFLTDPILADLSRRAIRVEGTAKRLASNGSPSQPGQGPGVVTGRLRASIAWRPGRDERGPYVDIGTAVIYGPFLENGTRNMAARPFLRPALQAARSV